MQTALELLLKRRRDRSIAIILNVKEREADVHLPPEVARKLRKVVLDQLNEFHEVCVDVLESVDNGDVVLNERYLRKIDELHDIVASKPIPLSKG